MDPATHTAHIIQLVAGGTKRRALVRAVLVHLVEAGAGKTTVTVTTCETSAIHARPSEGGERRVDGLTPSKPVAIPLEAAII